VLVGYYRFECSGRIETLSENLPYASEKRSDEKSSADKLKEKELWDLL
jgi:hypothetical protein